MILCIEETCWGGSDFDTSTDGFETCSDIKLIESQRYDNDRYCLCKRFVNRVCTTVAYKESNRRTTQNGLLRYLSK